MAKKIKGAKLIFEVTDDGSLKLLEGKLKGAKKATDNLSRSEATLNRNFKGASQQSSNTTKNFSKMAQGITGGLVPAYATLAANIFAIGAAFRFLQDAANYRILIQGQQEYATVTGTSLRLLTSRLQEATGGQLAFAEAAQSVAIAKAAGVTSDQLSRIGAVAKNASIALGRDLTDSLNRLVRGVTKAEPELLDELGIILRLEIAAEKYGAKIGKAAKDLNIFEKSQAVVNEVLEQGEGKFGEFNTGLNEFTKLAKTFDDLINKIKGGLTGIAEFIARGLANNIIALSGAFALLGSGVLNAITPQLPRIDVAGAAATASQDVSKFYTGARLGKFQQGAFGIEDIKALESSMSAKKSTVLNFETFTRTEAQKTLAILKARNLQLQADNAKTYKKMFLNWRANLALMQAEYGKFIGFMKTMGRGLTSLITFLGYAGLLVSVVGVLAQFVDKFKDPAILEFEETQKNLVKSFKEQNKEISRLNRGLKDTTTLMAKLNQLSNFYANFSFRGAADAFGGFENTRSTQGSSGFSKRALSKGQKQILEETIKALELQQGRLKEGSEEFKDIAKSIDIFEGALTSSSSSAGVSAKQLEGVKTELKDLGEEGTLATQKLKDYTTATQLLTNASQEFGKALQGMKQPTTGLSIITRSIRDFGETLTGLSGLDMNAFKDLGKGFDQIIDSATASNVATFIGQDKFNEIIGKRRLTGTSIKNIFFDPAVDKEIMGELGTALLEEANRLRDVEMTMLSNKMEAQASIEESLRGQGKLTASLIQKQGKLTLLEVERDNLKTLFDEKVAKGLKVEDAEYVKLEAQLELLDQKIKTAERSVDLMAQVSDVFRDSFEQGMATAFQSIIDGTKSMKEAFADMTMAILNSLAQILAQQAALSIMAMIGGPTTAGSSGGNNISLGGGPFGPMGRYGGIMSKRGRSFAQGGVPSGPESGYPVTLHGTEAVVPLGNDRHIPVKFENAGSSAGPVTVNVNMASGEEQVTGEDQLALGKAIASAVQQEIVKQQRPGGTLSPY